LFCSSQMHIISAVNSQPLSERGKKAGTLRLYAVFGSVAAQFESHVTSRAARNAQFPSTDDRHTSIPITCIFLSGFANFYQHLGVLNRATQLASDFKAEDNCPLDKPLLSICSSIVCQSKSANNSCMVSLVTVILPT
jgi:hypothetical protein